MDVLECDERAEPARTPPPGLLLRAPRPQDAEAVAEMLCLPGFRWGTLRLPYETPEEVRNRIEKPPPGSVMLLAAVAGRPYARAAAARCCRTTCCRPI